MVTLTNLAMKYDSAPLGITVQNQVKQLKALRRLATLRRAKKQDMRWRVMLREILVK
jgi:hypothetical protein